MIVRAIIASAVLAFTAAVLTKPLPDYELVTPLRYLEQPSLAEEDVKPELLRDYTCDGAGSCTTGQPLNQAPPCVDRFPRIPALAERLGVEQAKPSREAVVIEMCDGRAWDIFDIIDALLDRLEQTK